MNEKDLLKWLDSELDELFTPEEAENAFNSILAGLRLKELEKDEKEREER